MNLIGYRIENNKYYYLLQNWWKNKQFIEVDSDYMQSCNAIVTFVKTIQNEISLNFPLNFGKYGENNNIDLQDTFGCEN